MGFKKAEELRREIKRQRGEIGPTREQISELIEAAIARDSHCITVTHLDDKIRGELTAAGYVVNYPFRDMGVTAEISWRG